ncbi:LysR family transcriptional regulator [Pullulanibacillus camelliae]|uniref:LysR family transcriptional regulator n=1 Tax=Pullulanibacillus camelliae TaxID=1707096 RepID=A0A8J2YFP8_9BACL|nr:LysR family transcriptional regulator [Pullulanibacillus camelliae]GGE30836.1 LysR family transcriptional regulator [Pullulanibacillus camelliae]
MNLHALKLFLAVTKAGSVTQASQALCISQPAVTAQIKKFEKDLGVRLFKQKGRGIALTDVGEGLAEQARRLFALEEQMEDWISDYKQAKKGKLRIAATYLPANFLMPEWVAAFKTENKDAELVVTTTNSSEAFKQLIGYKADLAVYGGGLEDRPEDVDWEVLFEDELWFVVARAHRFANKELTLAEMMTEPFVMREKGSTTRERLFALCKTFNVRDPQIALQFNGLHEAIRAVMTGYGALFISSLVARDYVQSGHLARVKVQGPQLMNKFVICTRKDETPSPLTAAFVKKIRKASS